nr:hypothetical protein [Ochrobactrum sp. CM-21-5]
MAATFDHMNDAQLSAMVGRLGTQYQRNPKDRGTALNYASGLTRLGRNDQVLAGGAPRTKSGLSGRTAFLG